MSSYKVGVVEGPSILEGAGMMVEGAAIAAIESAEAIIASVSTCVAAGVEYGINEYINQYERIKELEAKKNAEEIVRKKLQKCRLLNICEQSKELMKSVRDKVSSISDYREVREQLVDLSDNISKLINDIYLYEPDNSDFSYYENKIKNYKREFSTIIDFYEKSILDKKLTKELEIIAKKNNEIEVEKIDNISLWSSSNVKRQKYYTRAKELYYNIKFYIEKEIRRFETIPIDSVDIETISSILKGVDVELYRILSGKIQIEDCPDVITSIEKKIEQYKVIGTLLDKKEKKYLTAYYSYQTACKNVNIAPRDIMEFDSMEELIAEINNLEKKLGRMKKCTNLMKEIGKDAYICIAMEYELNRLEYDSITMEESEKLLDRKLKKFLGDDYNAFHSENDDNIVQLYKTGKGTYVQVQLHRDGRTSIQTISDTSLDKKQALIERKKHSSFKKELKHNLKEDWFIDIDVMETESSDNINYWFDNSRANFEEVIPKIKREKAERERILKEERNRRMQIKAMERALPLKE